MPEITEASRTIVVEVQRALERIGRQASPFEPTPAAKAASLMAIQDERRGVSGDAQTARLLRAMRLHGEISRMEAERFLGIGHAPRRLKDIEEAGHHLSKRWVRQLSESGSEHRTVAYSLAFDAGSTPA